jgi:signal transduction histidine kinase
MTDDLPIPSIEARTTELFEEHRRRIWRRTDRMFAGLMIVQWIAAIATALWISPRTWAGSASWTHPHVWAAAGLGGCITILPVWLTFRLPAAAITRHTVATGQMLMSALLIHLTGGRIETHFHVFGSLAFLAFYRDWRVFVPATIAVAGDHAWRGLFWPESVFGIAAASPWRWLEHAGWVLFENAFLIASCRQSVHEMHDIAEHRARLERTKQIIEAEVAARTAELRALQNAHLETARKAGMADIATSVLHNVGNVLNSVNVSAAIIGDQVRKSGVADLRRAAGMLESHLDDPGAFGTQDSRGRHLPRFLVELSRKLTTDEERILTEVQSLSKGIDHIRDIVSLQQSYAGGGSLVEEVPVAELIEDAIRINTASLQRHGIDVIREFSYTGPLHVDKQKFLQILVNLVSNAKYAVLATENPEKWVRVAVGEAADDVLQIEVSDNGIGIPAENLTRIFSFGFTTRSDGHGFGLHSAANLAGELGGALTVHSKGPGAGAAFTLELPLTTRRATPCPVLAQ